jgi:hypothetical protein
MRVEILHIDDCANWEEAGRRVKIALAATGHADATITFRTVRSPADAAASPFAGSPTITVDDVDLFPSAERISDLACRVYVTPTGLAGVPTVEQLEEALG